MNTDEGSGLILGRVDIRSRERLAAAKVRQQCPNKASGVTAIPAAAHSRTKSAALSGYRPCGRCLTLAIDEDHLFPRSCRCILMAWRTAASSRCRLSRHDHPDNSGNCRDMRHHAKGRNPAAFDRSTKSARVCAHSAIPLCACRSRMCATERCARHDTPPTTSVVLPLVRQLAAESAPRYPATFDLTHRFRSEHRL